MSQFKLLMLAFLTIGYGVCTNSVVMADITWEITPVNLSSGPTWAGTALTNRASSGKTNTFGAQIVTPSKAGRAASRTFPTQHFTAPARTTTIQHSEPDTHTDSHH